MLGTDLDRSLELHMLGEGAAGIKSMGIAPRIEGRRNIPGGGDSQVDELIWGSDVDSSNDPTLQAAKAQLFQGRAGGTLQSKQTGQAERSKL